MNWFLFTMAMFPTAIAYWLVGKFGDDKDSLTRLISLLIGIIFTIFGFMLGTYLVFIGWTVTVEYPDTKVVHEYQYPIIGWIAIVINFVSGFVFTVLIIQTFLSSSRAASNPIYDQLDAQSATCIFCGTANPLDARVCSRCRTPLDPNTQPPSVIPTSKKLSIRKVNPYKITLDNATMNDLQSQARLNFIPDRPEKIIRFVAGFLGGIFIWIGGTIFFDNGKWATDFDLISLLFQLPLCAIVCAFLSLKFGDRFWAEFFRAVQNIHRL